MSEVFDSTFLLDIQRLRHGTRTQRAAWAAVTRSGILAYLADFDARWVGTIPIDVDIPGSDVDIVCYAPNLDVLESRLSAWLQRFGAFSLARKIRYGHPILVVEFDFMGWPFQIYGSRVPVDAQRGWVHMVAEAYLLAQGGETLRRAVRALKLAGEKTEPAFVQVVGLAGDPYEVLYELGLAVLGGNAPGIKLKPG